MENFVDDDLGYSPADIPLEMDKVNIIQRNISVWTLLKRIERKELQLEGYFQRKTGLWNNDTKSRLIESIIAGLPISAFYFDGSKDESWIILDGYQRLNAIKEFVIDKTLTLTGLYFYANTLNNKTFEMLSRPYQRRIEEYMLSTYIIQAGTPRNIKYKLYRNINIGSVPFSNQEIRHAINRGRVADYITSIANAPSFVKHITSKLPSDKVGKMLDKEIALRYVAFLMFRNNAYESSLIDFLDESMTELNYHLYPTHVLEQDRVERLNWIAQELEEAIRIMYDIFGDSAYTRNMFDKKAKKIFNPVLFEIWTIGLYQVLLYVRDKNTDDLDKFLSKKEEVREKTQELAKDIEFMQAINKPYTADSTRIRFLTIGDFIEYIIK